MADLTEALGCPKKEIKKIPWWGWKHVIYDFIKTSDLNTPQKS